MKSDYQPFTSSDRLPFTHQGAWDRAEKEHKMVKSKKIGSNDVIDIENLKTAAKSVLKNMKKVAGIDGVSVNDFKENISINLLTIQADISNKTFTPHEIKIVTIPKGNGEFRLIKIPTVRDRIVMRAISQSLSQVYNERFCDNSYCRTGKSTGDAAQAISQKIKEGYIYFIEIDISKFFDNIPHQLLFDYLGKDINIQLLGLIRKFIKKGCINNDAIGVPQGSPIASILANIVLHTLDVKLMKDGYFYYRYCDDITILARSRKSARKKLQRIINLLKQMGFNNNKKKTKIFNLSSGKIAKTIGYEFNMDGEILIPKKKYDTILEEANLVKETLDINSKKKLMKKIQASLRYYNICKNYNELVRQTDILIGVSVLL